MKFNNTCKISLVILIIILIIINCKKNIKENYESNNELKYLSGWVATVTTFIL